MRRTVSLSRTRLVLLLATAVTLGATGSALAYQNLMFQARDHLHAAYNDLARALHNKGGHRVAAMNLVREAIAEVNAGIRDGR